MAVSTATATLNSGFKIPLVGLGTWKAQPGQVGEAVKHALELGYRHIDCAAIYGNEAEIGAAFNEVFNSPSGPKREEVFVTSKLWNTEHKKDDVRPALEKTLKDLQLSYLDLYLIHWPMAWVRSPPPGTGPILEKVPFRETWEAMEALVDAGLVRSIGISNVNVELLIDILSYARIKPAVNQIELHPWLTQAPLADFFKKHDIHLTAYSPLGSLDHPSRVAGAATILEEPVVKDIAEKHKRSPAQVLLKWGVQKGFSVIPKSVHRHRIQENISIEDFTLSEEEVNSISGLNKNQRMTNPASWGKVPLFD